MENRFSGVTVTDIRSEIEKIDIEGSVDIYRSMIGFLDLTSLNSTDNESTIISICEKVNNFTSLFHHLPGVAAICVYPRFIPMVRKYLKAEKINIASVAGSFPSSQTFIENKVDECRRVIDYGADEIDIVISQGELLAGNFETVGSEIRIIKESVGTAHVKVILESGIIESPELIYRASMIAMESGADFIKTSTGKAAISATPEAAWVMCLAIKDFYKNTGKKIGFKPAGGISTATEAMVYYSIVHEILGKEWLTPRLFRIGASRLANDLLNRVEGRDVNYF